MKRRTRPEYAIKIAQFRFIQKLSQSKMAPHINVSTRAVIQWEGGVREPTRKNYLALAQFAQSRGALDYARFFRARIEPSRAARQRIRDKVYARRYLATMKARAAAGDEIAKDLLALTNIDSTEFARVQGDRIKAARKLKNAAFSRLFYEITSQTAAVSRLRLGRESAIGRGLRGGGR